MTFGFLMFSGGIVLLYSAIKGRPVADVLRGVIEGQSGPAALFEPTAFRTNKGSGAGGSSTSSASSTSGAGGRVPANFSSTGSGQVHGFVAGHGKGLGRAALIAFGKWAQAQGAHVSEGPPPFGPVHQVHVQGSEHYDNRALDIGIRSKAQGDKIARAAHRAGFDVIWQAAGHYDHVHISLPGSGF